MVQKVQSSFKGCLVCPFSVTFNGSSFILKMAESPFDFDFSRTKLLEIILIHRSPLDQLGWLVSRFKSFLNLRAFPGRRHRMRPQGRIRAAVFRSDYDTRDRFRICSASPEREHRRSPRSLSYTTHSAGRAVQSCYHRRRGRANPYYLELRFAPFRRVASSSPLVAGAWLGCQPV